MPRFFMEKAMPRAICLIANEDATRLQMGAVAFSLQVEAVM